MSKKILIVDDQKDIQLLLKSALEKEGYDIVLAEDGEQGLYQVIEDAPDLILTDVVMPKIGGIEFVKRLRQLEGGKEIPVIVISQRPLMVDCFETGTIEGFFPKPFDMKALIEKVDVVLAKRDLERYMAEKKKIEQEATQKQQGKRQGRKQEACKKCGKTKVRDAGHCPNCGCAEFVTRIVYD